ncbi:MAG: hypothetical protein PG981_000475 [Wolbachia endosymbiont of Ctenocephalides orientis wCori]|nr:MAG: hypothetical protein PG981_000475 [Wolbachia endosymbiont of Ctenocephalides orientis wCori]
MFTGPEKRITQIVTEHWKKLIEPKNNLPERDLIEFKNELPERDLIDKSDIMDSWQHCFIIEVKEQGYVCEDAGERVVEFYGFEKKMLIDSKYQTGAPFLRLYTIDAVLDKFDSVVENEEPVLDAEESESIKMRQVLLPLGNQEKVTHILGVITFKYV